MYTPCHYLQLGVYQTLYCVGRGHAWDWGVLGLFQGWRVSMHQLGICKAVTAVRVFICTQKAAVLPLGSISTGGVVTPLPQRSNTHRMQV
ncbi:hypothetical protein FKM82_025940 [Ascaphus truei]